MQLKRLFLKDMQLHELSLVDDPANALATTVMMKNRQGDSAMTVEELKAMLAAKDAEIKKQKQELDWNRDNLSAVLKFLKDNDLGLDIDRTDDGSISIAKRAPVEMIDFAGEKIAKSALPESVLKHLEAQAAQLEELTKAREGEQLAKMAEEAFPHLSGTRVQKAALMKAINGMGEGDKEAVLKSLKAADAAVAKSFAEFGHAAEHDEASPKAVLEKRAKQHATEHNVSYETAFAEITKSGEGRELLIKSRSH